MTFEANNIFLQKIEVASHHVDVLYQSALQAYQQQPQFLAQCLEELRTTLEELHIAEEELREKNDELAEAWRIANHERQRYQELFEFAPDGYLITDIYSRVREANRVAAELLNIPQKYLIGKLLINFVPSDTRRTFRSVLNQMPTIHRIQEWELCFRRREEGCFDASLTVEAVRDLDGKVVALRWLLRDISSRKRAEEQLRQTQLHNLQLIEADRLKTQFMSTISHELRTPMNAILGFSDLLLRQLRSHQDRRLLNMVERIFNNGKNLLHLIEEILDFSKLEAHRLHLRQETFDLVQLAFEICEELRPLAEQKALELCFQSEQPDLTLINDHLRVRQILVNLLSNAIKFTAKGRILVEIRQLPEERVVISVRDTGIGIAPRHLPYIFKEFWQADQSTTRQYGGTGLGLCITQALVDLMKGEITVESEVEKGSTFCVEIPRKIRESILT